ncbi:glycosyltransferase family 2 protein [Candidatus Peregrinibacteria bacterium]|nr:glycosyltransferase family 2 protein [Candidatus Peregrinibacteria bacterium]
MLPEVSIIIPCLNEAATLPIVIEKALRSFKRLHLKGEVVVADNGSTDGSVKVASKFGARVVHCSQKGYGNALRCGFKNAKGKYLIMGDADDSYDFSRIDKFIDELKNGTDLVMGTRLKGTIHKGAMPALHRYLGTPVLTFLINIFFGIKISDCNCGMRGLTRTAFDKLQMVSGGMEFASEMVIKAGIKKLKIKEIPIHFYPDKRGRKPHLKTWSDGWRHLKFIFGSLFSKSVLVREAKKNGR